MLDPFNIYFIKSTWYYPTGGEEDAWYPERSYVKRRLQLQGKVDAQLKNPQQ